MALPPVVSKIFAFLKKYRRLLIMVGTPVLLSPIPAKIGTEEAKAAYAVAIMAVFWISEVVPLAVTSLLPLVMFPMLGLIPAKKVCLNYMKDTNVLLLGGLLLSIAVEEWNVHKRIALRVLLLVGAQPRRLMLGFMFVTAFISMWITNTATTAMMTPIMEAVLKQLDQPYLQEHVDEDEDVDKPPDADDSEQAVTFSKEEGGSENIGFQRSETQQTLVTSEIIEPLEETETIQQEKVEKKEEIVLDSKQRERHLRLCKGMMLCIAYSANIGGTGTLTGTTPQLVLVGQFNSVFPGGPGVTFVSWFVYAFPQMLVFLGLAWLYLQAYFMGIGWKHLCFCFRGSKRNKTKGAETYKIMQKQYESLGPISYAEANVMILFLLLVLLWFFREEKGALPGWSEAFKVKYISDGTAAMIVGYLLFLLPSQAPDIPFIYTNNNRVKLQSKTLLSWKRAQVKIPWDVILLLGAGFALAQACETSGLSILLSCQLTALQSLPTWVIALIIATMLTFLTEITSNTATSTILLPVLASMARSIKVHPLHLMAPATACASFAFMLPVATPPNAIVFATGRLSVPDMAKAGFGMNIIGILIVTLAINTWGSAYYGLNDGFPDWAAAGNSTQKC